MKQAAVRKLASVPKQAQVWLDVGCGENKQPNCIGMDARKVPGVDVVHDVEKFPWPFADQTFTRITMSHLMEHIKPWLSIDVMNEMWRIIRPKGNVFMVMPYPGSAGHWQDPTHIKPWNETTPKYFDPEDPSGLYGIYKPKPWKIEGCVWRSDGNIEIAFSRREVK